MQSREKSEDTNYEDQCLTVGESEGLSEFEEGSQNEQCEEESSSSYNNTPKRQPFSASETPERTIDTEDRKVKEERKDVTYSAFGYNL